MFTKQHYVTISEILGRCEANDYTINSFVQVFLNDNPRFDSARFKEAVKKSRENTLKYQIDSLKP